MAADNDHGSLCEPDESTLIHTIRSGAPDAAAAAFCVLFDRTNGRLCGYLANKGLARPEIEAVAAETWSRAVEALPKYEARGIPLLAWLCRTASNVWHEHLRAALRTRPLPDGYETAAVDALSRDPLLQLLESEEREHLRAALRDVIDALTPDQRAVVEQRLIHEKSSQETASTLGWSVAKVDTTLHRARAACREQLLQRVDRAAPVLAASRRRAASLRGETS